MYPGIRQFYQKITIFNFLKFSTGPRQKQILFLSATTNSVTMQSLNHDSHDLPRLRNEKC
jgi:hypothetical protein